MQCKFLKQTPLLLCSFGLICISGTRLLGAKNNLFDTERNCFHALLTCSLHAVLRIVLTLEGTLACNRATKSSDRVFKEALLEAGLYCGAATGSPL